MNQIRKKTIFGLLFICFFLAKGLDSRGALITNGDFEDPPVGDYLYEQIVSIVIESGNNRMNRHDSEPSL